MKLKLLYKHNYLRQLFSFLNMSRLNLSSGSQRILAALISSVLLLFLFYSDSFSSNSLMPGEERSSLFYAITHLPLFAYGVLFLVFALSVANLVFQFRFVRGWSWPARFPGATDPKGVTGRSVGHSGKPAHHHGPRNLDTYKINPKPLKDGIVAIRSLNKDGDQTTLFPPTPLDGTNHPLPEFGSPIEKHSTETASPEKDVDEGTTGKEFRFSSAVDVPSHEEVERREKKRLVVSGFVLGPDDKPLGSAVVYLADTMGNKMGQSCRSNAENGSFKVLVHETGSYLLHAYKRGYAMADDQPIPIPIESGKIEEFVVNLISQGCLIQGRVVLQEALSPVPNIEIKCVCKRESFTGASRTDDEGNFRFPNVPMNSECYLEAFDNNGSVLTRTEGFQTVQKKQLHRDIQIPLAASAPYYDSPEVLNPFLESKQDDGRNDVVISVSGS